MLISQFISHQFNIQHTTSKKSPPDTSHDEVHLDFIFLHGRQWWVIALWNILSANDLFGINFDWAHPAAWLCDPALHLDLASLGWIHFQTDLWSCELTVFHISFLTHCWLFPQFHQFLPSHMSFCLFVLHYCEAVLLTDTYFDQDITSIEAVTTGCQIFRSIKEWQKINYLKNSLTTAVTFPQAALARLNRRSRAGVTGCVTWPTPLLGPCPACDCALCPLWPGGPAILTVFSWKKYKHRCILFYFYTTSTSYFILLMWACLSHHLIWKTHSSHSKCLIFTNKYVVHSQRQTGCGIKI